MPKPVAHKTHIFEGSNGAGRLLFRCGRSVDRTNALRIPYVGCALLKERGGEITCARCIRYTHVRYGVVLPRPLQPSSNDK